MPEPGPRTTYKYSDEFKASAVRLGKRMTNGGSLVRRSLQFESEAFLRKFCALSATSSAGSPIRSCRLTLRWTIRLEEAMRVLIHIDVPDLEAAVVFYQAAVGLTLSRIIDDDVAELVGASCVLYLLRKDAGTVVSSTATVTRRYTRHWTPVHIDFVVANIEEAEKRATDAGAKKESLCVEWMGSKCITFSDPFGHGFCLIEFSGKTYSESAA